MSNFDEKLKNLSSEVSGFIFKEAKVKLTSVNQDRDILDKKSFTIITALLAILGFIASFTTNDLSIEALKAYKVLISGFGFSILLLFIAVATTSYYGDSFKPSDILKADKYYLNNIDILNNGFLLNWYDGAIRYNIRKNKVRGWLINIALFVALTSLSTFIIMFVESKQI